MGQLYKISFSTTSKVYIGISGRSADKRFAWHSNPRNKSVIAHAIRKHSGVTLSVLAEEDDFSRLLLMEVEAIRSHNSKYPNGYNITDGGDGVQGFKWSDEDKAKQSERARLQFSSDEARKNMSEKTKRMFDSDEFRTAHRNRIKEYFRRTHIPVVGTYGMLSVISNKRIDGKLYALCKCECGAEKNIRVDALKSGVTKSCGCLSAKLAGDRLRKHGLIRTNTYSSWRHMKDKCLNVKNSSYQKNGGIGISVCERWMVFENFLEDMGAAPEGMEILDRIDVNGNFDAGNCKWVTSSSKSRNRRNNVNITFNGKTQCIADWCKELGFSSTRLSSRIKNGWTVEKAFTTPAKQRKQKTN